MPARTRNSKGCTEADYEGLQRYIKNRVAEDKRAGLYPYEDWNYAGSNVRRARYNGQYHSSKNKQQNRNPPFGNHQESFPSSNTEQKTSPHETSNYNSNSKILSNSPLKNVNSPVKVFTELSSSASQNISSQEAPLPLPIDTSANSLLNSTPRDETSFNIQQGISSHITSKASPSSDDSNRQAAAAIPSFLKEKIATLKAIINARVGIFPCLPEPSRKETMEIINQMEVFLTQPLQQCQRESPTSCHCNHRDQVSLPPSISYHIDQIVNLSPSSSQSVSKKPALLLHPIHD
ncbi:hypothetical protein AVEN_89553-1 [Araneus ventricosus]|uniref:Uncharacterized protein n=1 Tax=Araneus ventricosus TaxID=182803 RepID=A0A4Y2N0C0_ARAVE|nr:hypothetical protein AVEN_89553-1 [Araneus ventricosus]